MSRLNTAGLSELMDRAEVSLARIEERDREEAEKATATATAATAADGDSGTTVVRTSTSSSSSSSLAAAAKDEDLTAEESALMTVEDVEESMSLLQKDDQKFALVNELHYRRAIQSSNGRPWLRILGFFPTEAEARAFDEEVIQSRQPQATRVVETCKFYVLAAGGSPACATGTTKTDAENARIGELLLASQDARVRLLREFRHNRDARRMGDTQLTAEQILVQDGDAPDRAVAERATEESKTETEPATAEPATAEPATPSSKASSETASKAPSVGGTLRKIRMDQQVRRQNYAAVLLVDDVASRTARNEAFRSWADARDEALNAALDARFEAEFAASEMTREAFRSTLTELIAPWIEENPAPWITQWNSRREAAFKAALQEFARENPHYDGDGLVGGGGGGGDSGGGGGASSSKSTKKSKSKSRSKTPKSDAAAAAAAGAKGSSYKDVTAEQLLGGSWRPKRVYAVEPWWVDFLVKHPEPSLAPPTKSVPGVHDNEVRAWLDAFATVREHLRWEAIGRPVPDRFEILRPWFAAHPRPRLADLPPSEPLYALLFANDTDRNVLEEIKANVDSTEALRDFDVSVAAMYDAAPLMAVFESNKINRVYKKKEMQELVESEMREQRRKRELAMEAKIRGKHVTAIDILPHTVVSEVRGTDAAATHFEDFTEWSPLTGDASASVDVAGGAGAGAGASAGAGGLGLDLRAFDEAMMEEVD